MNAYDAAKRLYSISDDLGHLADKLSRTSKVDEKIRIEKQINQLEVEFFTLKHTLQKRSL